METPKIIDKEQEKLIFQKTNEELMKSLSTFRKTISYMTADAPIGVLCLPKEIENILTKNGFNRIYDIFDTDLTKVKGLGASRLRYLTSRLNEFFSIS